MTTNPREMFGDQYRLTILEKDGDAPPATEKMFRMVLDELGVRGNFNFHAKSHLPPSPADSSPKMSARLAGNEILVTMRWGVREADSVSGSLFVPNGSRPAEVQAQMAKLLGRFNADGWTELKLSRSDNAEAPPPPAAPMQPIKVAPAQPPVAAAAALAVIDEGLALELFKKAGANATIKQHQVAYHLSYHHPQPGNHAVVGETLARLVEKGSLRRVSTGGSKSEWQFTEAFLEAHGLTVAGYEPLPGVAAQPRVRGAKVLQAALSETVPRARTTAPAPQEPAHPDTLEVDALCDDLERLHAERPQMVAHLEEAQRALGDLDAKMAAKKVAIAVAMKEAIKRCRCEDAL
jgi:hypothetical protein